jgi:hypothetical protein
MRLPACLCILAIQNGYTSIALPGGTNYFKT